MRAIGIGLTLALLIVAWFAFARDQGVFGLSGRMTLDLVWSIMALLVVSGAAFGFRRMRAEPNLALAGMLIWTAILIIAVLVYRVLN